MLAGGAVAAVGTGALLASSASGGQSAPATAGPAAPGDMGQGKLTTTSDRPLPVLFLAHGSPMTLEDPAWMAELAAWAAALPRPKAVLMISAHWEARPTTLGATRTVPLVYDFYGFPERFYGLRYPAPGAPWLASRVSALLAARGEPVAEAPERGLDHGAYVPLMAMYPGADVPVLQLSLPTLEPAALFSLGQALSPLRAEGVLIVGSGFLTHNLRLARFGPAAGPPPAWAAELDAWCTEVLSRRDADALIDYRHRAPGVSLALPTHEHFVPVVTALGAAPEPGPVRFPITGWLAGSLTRRSVELG